MIRPATIDDVPAIAVINRLARDKAMPWLPVLHSLEGDTRFFTRVVAEQSFAVAEVDGDPVGFCAVQDGWIEQLYIHPDHQRQGLGSSLIAWAQDGAQALQLWAFEQNHAAQAFYAKHGFVEAERTDGRNNAEKTPDVRMTWTRWTSDG
ncbi:GNAT family N-acetyltransferase [Gymnodinialimonas ulvae]|uniref:GNAT family N-acetyltransferase n=1 Tax=Gymnodinialimonas ulvae TaxID=3126504 RepID=UPI0030A608B6